jgi:hypothetical protein
MAYLPEDPDTALGFVVAIIQAEEHKRGVWEPFDPRQATQISRLVDADRAGQLTRGDIQRLLHEIARTA